MSDDRIINFNDLKNKVKETDIDKFEQYVYDLYYSLMNGNMNMAEFSRKIMNYMQENDISQEKFLNIQKKFMERYGMDSNMVDEQLKHFGIDPQATEFKVEDVQKAQQSINFYEKYGTKINAKSIVTTYIKNDINDIEISIDQEKVILYSSKKISLMDSELNEFLLGYKNMLNKSVRVVICENYSEYDY